MHRLVGAAVRAVRLGAVVMAYPAGLQSAGMLTAGMLVAWAFVSGAAVHAEEDQGKAAAIESLREAGLTKIEDRWLLPVEMQLQHRFATMHTWRDAAFRARKALRKLAAEQAGIQKEIDALQATQSQLEAARETHPNLPRLERRLKKIANRLDDLAALRQTPTELANRPDVRAETIRLMSSVNRVHLLESRLSRRLQDIATDYETLADQKPVDDALTALDAHESLGSGKDYLDERRKLSLVSKNVVPEPWPVYGQNGKWRTSVILEERQVTTVTIVQDTKERPYPAWLPASVLQAAGIEIPAGAPAIEVHLPTGRRVPTRLIRLTYLRFGKHRIGGVEFLAIGPEDEDLGAQVSLQFLEKHGLRLDLEPLPGVVGK